MLAALAAALSYALASVLQHWEAEKQPADTALRLSLVARLARRPRWVAGLGFDVGGYAVQWWALTIGSLVLVQPLLVLGLLFALPIKARFTAYRFHGWDWAGALLTTAGLAVFLVVSRPAAGHTNVSALTWTVVLTGAGVLAGALVALGRRSSPRWKAVSYGAAGGIVYGACAALTKSCAHLLSLGVSHLFQSWQPYLLAGAGVAGMVLAQSAFQAGPLDASLAHALGHGPDCQCPRRGGGIRGSVTSGSGRDDARGVVLFGGRGRHFLAGAYRSRERGPTPPSRGRSQGG